MQFNCYHYCNGMKCLNYCLNGVMSACRSMFFSNYKMSRPKIYDGFDSVKWGCSDRVFSRSLPNRIGNIANFNLAMSFKIKKTNKVVTLKGNPFYQLTSNFTFTKNLR